MRALRNDYSRKTRSFRRGKSRGIQGRRKITQFLGQHIFTSFVQIPIMQAPLGRWRFYPIQVTLRNGCRRGEGRCCIDKRGVEEKRLCVLSSCDDEQIQVQEGLASPHVLLQSSPVHNLWESSL